MVFHVVLKSKCQSCVSESHLTEEKKNKKKIIIPYVTGDGKQLLLNAKLDVLRTSLIHEVFKTIVLWLLVPVS